MDIKRYRWAAAALLLLLATTATPVGAQEKYHCGEIRRNETWKASETHLVCASGVTVFRSTLTIEAGADVLMEEGANLVIEADAALVADGTEAQNIRVRSNSREDTPGFWGQIRFNRGAEQSVMRRIYVQSGGREGVPMVQADDTVVLMDWIVFRWAADVPLAFTADALGPSLDAPGQSTAGGACQRVQFASNGADAIAILGDAQLDVTDNHTWHNFCAPYRASEEIVIGGPIDPILILDLGVVIQFSGSGTLVAGFDADQPGQLLSNGSSTEPVVLTAESGAAGDWTGVVLTEYSGLSSFINTRFEYGGRDDQPMLTVRSVDATALGVSFHESAGYPLAIVPAAVSSFMSSLFDIEEPVFIGNAVQRVLVLADESPVVTRSGTWGDAGAPFELNDSLTVAGPALPRLTLSPGAELIFPSGGALIIGDGELGPGELEASGSDERPVVFTGLEKTAGAWSGVDITDDATLARVVLAVIEYGGTEDDPMLQWGRVAGDLARTTFRGAVGYPVEVPLSVANDVILSPDVPEEDEGSDLRNTFVDNGVDRVLIEVDRSYTESASEWSDPGAPVEFDDTVIVSSPSRPLLELNSGLRLLFRPNAAFQLGRGDSGRASFLVDVEDPEAEPVSLEPVNPEAGWLGLRVLAGSSMLATGLVVKDVSEAGSAISVEDATATLENVRLKGRQRGTGVHVTGDEAMVNVSYSTISGNKIGVHTRDGGVIDISRSFVEENVEWGFFNEDPDLCLIANLVYWGDPSGPNDESDEKDDCLNGDNINPGGDRVSDDVDWWPYAINADFDPSPGLGPNPWKAFCPRVVR